MLTNISMLHARQDEPKKPIVFVGAHFTPCFYRGEKKPTKQKKHKVGPYQF